MDTQEGFERTAVRVVSIASQGHVTRSCHLWETDHACGHSGKAGRCRYLVNVVIFWGWLENEGVFFGMERKHGLGGII